MYGHRAQPDSTQLKGKTMQTTLSLTKATLIAAMVTGWTGYGWNSGHYFADADGRSLKEPSSYRLTDEAKTVCAWGAIAINLDAVNASDMHMAFNSAARKAIGQWKLDDIADVSNRAGSKEKAIADVTAYLDANWPADLETLEIEYDKAA